MTELLDPGLRARFDAALPAPALDDAAVGSLLRHGRRRRRARQAGLGVAAVVAVAALAVGGMSLLDRRPAPPVAPPDDEATVGADLWLSAEEVPPGAEVVGVLVDPTNSGQVFDQLASVERWIDGKWVDRAEPLLWCLPTDPCSAEVMPPGTMVDFQPVEIAPEPATPGPAMRMSTAGLEPGWYRISHVARSGATASAVLEIDADAPAAAPLAPLDERSLAVGRPVLTTDSTGPLVVTQVVPDGHLPRPDPADEARVDAWVDGDWVTVEDPVALTGDIGDGAQAVMVPRLDPGAYRVVLSWPDGEDWGRFWVVDAPRVSNEVRRQDAVILQTYAGLPDDERYGLVEGPPGAASYLFVDADTLLVSLAGTGECSGVPVATELSGRELAVVVREPAEVCAPDGTFTTYVLALPAGVPAEPWLTTRADGSRADPYPALRSWLGDVVAKARLEVVPGLEDDGARNATVVVSPRTSVTVVAELAEEARIAARLVPDGTVEVKGLVLETGTDVSGSAAARFACGGIAFTILGSDDIVAAFEDVRSVAEAVARAAQPCPVDADAIAVP